MYEERGVYEVYRRKIHCQVWEWKGDPTDGKQAVQNTGGSRSSDTEAVRGAEKVAV